MYIHRRASLVTIREQLDLGDFPPLARDIRNSLIMRLTSSNACAAAAPLRASCGDVVLNPVKLSSPDAVMINLAPLKRSPKYSEDRKYTDLLTLHDHLEQSYLRENNVSPPHQSTIRTSTYFTVKMKRKKVSVNYKNLYKNDDYYSYLPYHNVCMSC